MSAIALVGLLTACDRATTDLQPDSATINAKATPTSDSAKGVVVVPTVPVVQKDSLSAAVLPFLVNMITVDELPAAVKQYVATTYPTWTIGKPAVLLSGTIKSFYVPVGSTDPADFQKYGYGAINLSFDEQGVLMSYGPHSKIGTAPSDVTLAETDIPASVRADWQRYWPGSTLQTAATNTSGVKRVVVRNGTISYQLVYDKNWVLLSITKL